MRIGLKLHSVSKFHCKDNTQNTRKRCDNVKLGKKILFRGQKWAFFDCVEVDVFTKWDL